MGICDVESSKYAKLKKAFVVEGSKYVKLKKGFIVESGKYVKLWASSLFTKAHAIGVSPSASAIFNLVLNNSDITNDSTWVASLRGDSIGYMYPVGVPMFGKYYYGCGPNSSVYALKYSTDGITFTEGTTLKIPRLTSSSTAYLSDAAFDALINCNGRLFGRITAAYAQGGSQAGGGGTRYVTFIEFDSTGAILDQATGYEFSFSSTNSGYGFPIGNFNRSYSEPVYHNGYIYHAIARRTSTDNGMQYLSLERYNISTKTFEVVASDFWSYAEPEQNGTIAYSSTSGVNVHLFDNSLLINYNFLVFRYDFTTGAMTNILSLDSTKCTTPLLRVTENTFLDVYSSPHRVYTYDGTTMTLVTTHSNDYRTGGVWAGDRYVTMYATRSKGTATTAPITLAYTLDGITFTINEALATTPEGAFADAGTSKTSFAINILPVPN